MESIKIQITSNSTPESIQKDFENSHQCSKLDLSLEIQVDHEELILKSIIEQMQHIVSLEDLSITIEPFCILEHFQIFAIGLSTMEFIKTLTVKFSSICFAEQTQIQHLASAIKNLSLLTNLSILIDERNYFDDSQIALLSECFSTLKELNTLKIQISSGNPFSNQAMIDLSKGLTKINNLKDLSLSLNFTNIHSEGMDEFSSTIKNLKQLNKLELTLLNEHALNGSILQVFQSITTLSQLKSLLINPQNTLQIQSTIIENSILGFSNLTQLESLTLKNVLRKKETENNQLSIKTISNLEKLKHFDTQIINFNQIHFDNISISDGYLNKLTSLTNLTLEVNDIDTTRDNQFVSILSNSLKEMKELLSLKITFECKTEKVQSLSFMNSIKELINLNSLDLIFSDKFYLDKDIYNSLGQSLSCLFSLNSIRLKRSSTECYNPEKRIQSQNGFWAPLLNLKQLEELWLEGIQVQNEHNQTLSQTLQKLVNFKKLRIETSFDCAQIKTTEMIFTPFTELQNLIDLTFVLYFSNSQNEIENLKFFNSLAQLKDLQSLRLEIEADDVIIFQSLGIALSSLSQLKSVQIKSVSCSLLSLNYIISGLKSSLLKQLTFDITTLTNDNIESLTSYENMFEGIQNLEIFNFEIQKIKNLFNLGQMLFRGLQKLKQLVLIDIKLLICQPRANILECYQSLRDFIQLQHNLLSFKLRIALPPYNSNYALNWLNEGLEQCKNIRVLEIYLKDFNQNMFCFMKSTAGMRNLRQNLLIILNQINFSQTQMIEYKQIDQNNLSKYLTELFISFQNIKYDGDILANVFRSIRNYQYLNLLSLTSNTQPHLTNDAVSVLGQSLQCIQNLHSLILKISLTEEINSESTFQLAQGIRYQQKLQSLKFHVGQKSIYEFSRLNTIAESIKYLAKLEIIDIIITIKDRDQNKQSLLDFIEILGKSIADHTHLKILALQIIDLADALQGGMVQLGNFIQSNCNLQFLKFELKTQAVVSQVGPMSLSQGISQLRQLKILKIVFGENEKISDQELLNFAENVKQLESLRSIGLEFFENTGQNPVLVKVITNSLAQLNLLERVDLYFHNFLNEEQHSLEIDNIFKKRQILQSFEGKFELQAKKSISQLFTNFRLENKGFSLSLTLVQEKKCAQKDLTLLIERLAEHIPKHYKTVIFLNSVLDNDDLDDFVKIISQIKSKELEFSLKCHRDLSNGLLNILKAISSMVNLTNLDLNLIDNQFSHKILFNSVSQLSKSQHLKYLQIIHKDDVQKKVNLLTFNKYIRALCKLKNLNTLNIYTKYFNKKFYVPIFRLINRLHPKLVEFILRRVKQSK